MLLFPLLSLPPPPPPLLLLYYYYYYHHHHCYYYYYYYYYHPPGSISLVATILHVSSSITFTLALLCDTLSYPTTSSLKTCRLILSSSSP